MNKLKAMMLAGAAALVLASPANAADTAIIMWTDAFDSVTSTGTGSVDLGPQNLDGVTVTLTVGKRVTLPNGLNEANINIDNTTASTQTLNIILGANEYLGLSDAFKLSGTIISDSGKADLAGSYFVDALDTLNGQGKVVVGTDIKNFDSGLLTGPNSFSFNGFGSDLVTGPYGLAERLTLTLAPGASVGVQGVAMIAVPESKTWAMLGIGFALMAMLGLKKRKVTRYAI
jgi:hypothetical protein